MRLLVLVLLLGGCVTTDMYRVQCRSNGEDYFIARVRYYQLGFPSRRHFTVSDAEGENTIVLPARDCMIVREDLGL